MSFIKKVIPSALYPIAREIKFRISSRENEALLLKEVKNVSKQWKRIFNNTSKPPVQEDGLNLLFITGYGVGTSFLTIEPIIMANMIARGHKVSSLFCNGSLPSCEYNVVGNNNPDSKMFKTGVTQKAIHHTCNKCKSNIVQNYGNLPIELLSYSDYLKEGDLEKITEVANSVSFEDFRGFVYEDIAVGEEAFSSILRATFKGEVKDTKSNRVLVHRYLISSMLLSIVCKRAFQKEKPDRVLMIHGVYQTHGIPAKVARSMNIPVIIMGGGGIRKDTVVMCHHETYHLQLVNEPNSLWINREITEKEKSEVLKYAFQKRHAGNGVDYLHYHPNPIEDIELIKKEIGINNKKPIVSVFTNVIWDAQIFYDGNAFKNIFDWIQETIILASKNLNINLVIRIHPGEVKSGNPTRQPMKNEIENMFPDLPSNVYIIAPESDISSYILAEASKASIIYGTKMGLELALMKAPLIICGETFSRNKGYGLDIKSKQQYAEVFSSIENYETDIEKAFDLAIKYANYFYFRRMLKLPYTSQALDKKIDFNQIEDLLKIEEMNVIADGIEKLTPFHFE